MDHLIHPLKDRMRVVALIGFGAFAVSAAAVSALPLAAPALAETNGVLATPIVESIVGPSSEPVHRSTAVRVKPIHRLIAARRHHRAVPIDIERPALAGVVLVEPLGTPPVRPRPIVRMPSYFIDGIAADFTTPPPPVVCEHRPRDPLLPDPHLYREVPVVCGYDIN